jgi:anti-sigma B factor antagonist
MPNANVSTAVRRARSGVNIIDIQGEINAFAEKELFDAYAMASSSDTHTILLNFDGLKYMNSSGIGLLVTLLVRARRQNQRFMAFGLNEHYKQIFELTRLNEAVSLYDTEADALVAANQL